MNPLYQKAGGWRKALLLASLAAGVCGGWFVVDGRSGEPPLRAAVHELVDDSGRYDGRQVVVSGLVRSIEFQQGRRGSEYLILNLEEEPPTRSGSTPSVKVIGFAFPNIAVGAQVQVQGIYHREGKWGGHSYEYFIEAQEVRRENAT